ncbi:hypothetical protein AVEN_217421-1 [Araneus ventricosus]|uniref:Uncharacterized protein n=1 Tax=Araneus ventricosus TaxID=182803 RepID=A0A4Y2NT59_ARAVE|nr:hypothetical protein AVEN_217421-1 [Araneus ventricosus]
MYAQLSLTASDLYKVSDYRSSETFTRLQLLKLRQTKRIRSSCGNPVLRVTIWRRIHTHTKQAVTKLRMRGCNHGNGRCPRGERAEGIISIDSLRKRGISLPAP